MAGATNILTSELKPHGTFFRRAGTFQFVKAIRRLVRAVRA